MSDSPLGGSFANYCECLASVKPTGKVLAARTGIVALTAVLLTAMLVVTLKAIPAVSFMLTVILVFCAWFVWQFTKIEYEYTIAAGSFELDKIFGARTRKKVREFKISDIERLFPVTGLEQAAKNASSVLWTCKKTDAHALGILYTDGAQKHILMICAPDKTRACLKYFKGSLFTA